jgi:chromosome partitioning protein
MTRTVAIANQKGGVGKTTTTLALGAALTARGKRVLLVDADPQGSLTLSCGLNPDALDDSLYGVLHAELLSLRRPLLPEILTTTQEGLALAPSNIELSQMDLEMPREPLGVYALRDALAPVKRQYHVVLIDCPPNLGAMTMAALAAAGSVLVPMQVDYLATKGLDLLFRTIARVQTKINRRLRVEGVVYTMVDGRTSHAREVMAQTSKRLHEAGVRVFETTIRYTVRVKEAPVARQSVVAYAKGSPVADAYCQLAKEMEW